MKRRIVSLALLLTMLLSAAALSACGDSTPVVMQLGDHTVTAAMYQYWASSCKGQYIYQYEDVNNTAEFWNSEVRDGVSAAEYFDGITLDNIKTTLVVMKMFDDYGLSLTNDEKNSISDYISDLIKERAEGSKNMMNSMLGQYGVNLKILEKIYRDEAKSAHVYDYLYGENGKEKLDDDALEAFYKENYVHFNMIYVNDAYRYVTDEDGKMVTGDDGYYKTEELDSDTAAKKAAVIEDATSRLAAGEDFASVYKDCDELGDRLDYYYTAAASYNGALYYQLVAAAAGLEDYETTAVKSDLGTCIIQKLPLEDGAWADSEYADFFPTEGSETFRDNASASAFRDKIAEYYDDITVDEEAIKQFSAANVVPCYFF